MATQMNEKVMARMIEMAPLDFEKCGKIAEEFGLKQRAIVASATRNGIAYNKKARVSKTGDPIVSKADLVETIADSLNVTVESLDGLDKANKSALETIVSTLMNEG